MVKATAPHGKIQRLRRSTRERVIAGVCSGLGAYFELDPVIFRIVFILITIFGGSGILLYILLWILIPAESHIPKKPGDTVTYAADEMRARAQDLRVSVGKKDTATLLGYLLLGIGVWVLLSQHGLMRFFHAEQLWPLILVAAGIIVISRSGK